MAVAIKDFAGIDIEEKKGGADFHLPGYSVEFLDRKSDTLIVTFPSASKEYPASIRDSKAWGREFVARRGYSVLHIKTDQNCWYRRPSLTEFFHQARDAGLFGGYRKIMTYGGSMGGYGALAFAGRCNATHCLALNPQVRLGPSVRDWENRFRGADRQDWTRPDADINLTLPSVPRVVVVYDPYLWRDRRHIEMIRHDSLLKLHVPFVGHRVPDQLQKLGQLAQLFDATIEDRLDEGDFYRSIRARRDLPIWRAITVARAASQASACRHAILTRDLPEGAVAGPPAEDE